MVFFLHNDMYCYESMAYTHDLRIERVGLNELLHTCQGCVSLPARWPSCKHIYDMYGYQYVLDRVDDVTCVRTLVYLNFVVSNYITVLQ